MDPARPLKHLFGLNEVRNTGAHAGGKRQQKLAAELERFGIGPGALAGGYGRALDIGYDCLADEPASICHKLGTALRKG